MRVELIRPPPLELPAPTGVRFELSIEAARALEEEMGNYINMEAELCELYNALSDVLTVDVDGVDA